jgi:putative transposase
VLENLALRHQLAVLQRTAPRPRLRPSDRLFWVLLARLWHGWFQVQKSLKPVRCHRMTVSGLTWAARARPPGGRPRVPRADPHHGSRQPPVGRTPHPRRTPEARPQISQATVSKYLVRRRTPPSQTWRTFLANHVGTLVSVDFFVVPTVLFKVLFVFVVLAHERRRVVHVNVTDAPTAQWTAQQLVEAFPWQTAPRYLLRDRDAVYGVAFSRRAQSMGIHEVKTAPRSPWHVGPRGVSFRSQGRCS